MGEYLDKEGLTRFKEKMLTEVDERIGASGGGTVTSVDGKTGAVDLSNTYQPKGNYLTSAPVTSVNGSKGDVTINDYVTGITISGKTVTITKKNGTSTTQTTQDTTYALPTASSSTLGGVKTGSNITNSSGTISLTKSNVTGALGYTPLQTAPVTSVDGKTGAVDLSGTYQPKGNYLTSAPVTSVNGQTGAVTISIPATPKAYVTETWSNGTSWYRKYSDGWIEQGGYNNGTNSCATVTFHVAMANTNYSVRISRHVLSGTADDVASISHQARSCTTTSMQVRQTFSTANAQGTGYGGSFSYDWVVCGYHA